MKSNILVKMGFVYSYDDRKKLEIYTKPIDKFENDSFSHYEIIYADGDKIVKHTHKMTKWKKTLNGYINAGSCEKNLRITPKLQKIYKYDKSYKWV